MQKEKEKNQEVEPIDGDSKWSGKGSIKEKRTKMWRKRTLSKKEYTHFIFYEPQHTKVRLSLEKCRLISLGILPVLE